MKNTLEYARQADAQDELRGFRQYFHIPKRGDKEVIYLCGNSLGLQPKSATAWVQEEMEKWAAHGVAGHFVGGKQWKDYHHLATEILAALTGAKSSEVTAMGSLTANLHFALASFYQPTSKRRKILYEARAFSSDEYAFASQVRWHGGDPAQDLVALAPRAGEYTLRKEDILHTIRDLGDELALVVFGGVNYYTGQFFPLAEMARAAHTVGARIGIDLAHTIGNVPLQLHDWEIDFAVWCSYKYLNSGPGGVGGLYIHEKHHRAGLPRLEGWWGHEAATRFLMPSTFVPDTGVRAWQLSNVPILLLACHQAALEIFAEAGIERLRQKSIRLTNYMAEILGEVAKMTHYSLCIISPESPDERGCQLSISIPEIGRRVYESLQQQGVEVDWREPAVIRVAPVPLYNTFEDVFVFGQILSNILREMA